jgi:hypothetical protein
MFVIYITQALIDYRLTFASDFNKKWHRQESLNSPGRQFHPYQQNEQSLPSTKTLCRLKNSGKYIFSQICWVGLEENNWILGRKILAPAGSYFLSWETRQALLLIPPRTLAESALNDSLHSINDSEWSVVSNSDNDIYVNAQYWII